MKNKLSQAAAGNPEKHGLSRIETSNANRHNQPMMRSAFLALFLIICLNSAAQSQSPDNFAGCYQVTSLVWSPRNAEIGLIPQQLELMNTPVLRSGNYFRMRSVGTESHDIERLWAWWPKGKSKAELSWSGGLGGIKGTLKQSKNGGLTGTIKEWCDSRCGWKKASGHIHLQRTPCATD
jgi:hypothetical protein